MAFVSNEQEDEEQKQGGPVAPAGGGAVHLAPSSGVGPSGPSGAATAPQAGGSFASLDKYLAANQGQAEPLAGKITGAIDNEYQGLDQGSQGVLQGLQSQVASAPGYTKGDSDLLAKEAADPTAFAGDKNNVAAFQKQLTNSYGGPNSAEGTNDFQAQQAKINNAISQGNAKTQTEAGRTQLVSENSAKPTTGVVALNSAILSQDPNYLGKVENAYKPFQNLVSGLNTGAQGIDQTIASKKADAASSSKAANDAITGQMTGLNTAINNQLATQQGAAATRNQAVKADLASGNVSPQDLQTLGLTQDQWNSLSSASKAAATSQLVSSADNKFQAQSGTAKIDPTQWLTQIDPNAAFNAGNVATADQYGKAQAFQTLLGGLNLATPQLVINPADAAKAGTAPTNLNSFDYGSALKGAQDTSSAETAAAKAYVDAMQSGADEEHAQLAAANAQKNANAAAGGSFAALGPAGPLMAGGATGQFNALKSVITNPSLKSIENAPGQVISGVTQGVSNAVHTVTNFFCFHPLTLIEMADGSLLPICQVNIGDDTKGGKVLATLRGVATEFYWYGGVLVTGKHAVKEGGTWVRVEDSQNGRKFKHLTEVVCNLVTEKHRIYANGIEFADNNETDAYEMLDLNASLAELNKHG